MLELSGFVLGLENSGTFILDIAEFEVEESSYPLYLWKSMVLLLNVGVLVCSLLLLMQVIPFPIQYCLLAFLFPPPTQGEKSSPLMPCF